MKKRIIAAFLVVIMTVLALASCGTNLAKDDLSEYIEGEFDVNKFIDAIRNIEITDGEYTTNPDTNNKVIASDIYGPIASGVITAADTYEDDKLTDGKINAGDVVYYCYYITYEDENGVVRAYKRSEMDEKSVTASATKAKHVINLGKYVKDQNSFDAKLAAALLAQENVAYYSTMDASAVKNEFGKDALTVTSAYTIALSYTVSYGDGDAKITEKVAYEIIDLSDATNPLAAKLVSYIGQEKTSFKIGESVKVPAAEDATSQTDSFEVTVGEGDDAVTYKYSALTVNYLVDKTVADGSEITFKFTDSSLVAAAIDSMDGINDATTSTTDLSKKEVTFHIYPVYRLSVPESNAASILEYVYGKKIADYFGGTTTSFGYGTSLVAVLNEVLADEGYKCADEKTVKFYVDAIKDLYAGTYTAYEDLKALEEARKTANTEYEEILKKTDATEAEKDAKEDALDAAEKALADKVRETIKAEIAKIVAAKNGDLVLGTELFKALDEELRHNRKEEYDSYITKTVAKEINKIIDSQIKVVDWPKDLEKEFYNHLYDTYEYNFYNGNYSSSDTTTSGSTTATETNYSHYDGDLMGFLKDQTKAADEDGVKKAITEEARTYITPIIKLFVVAQAIDDYSFDGKSADALLSELVEKDIELGVSDFKAYNYFSSYLQNFYFDSDTLTDKENEKQENKEIKNVEKSVKNARESAKDFLVDDAAFKAYKKQLGRKNYRAWEQSYGELNIRASLQFNKLFYLLTYTNKTLNVDEEEQHIHAEVKYVERDGKLYHDYSLVKYTVK